MLALFVLAPAIALFSILYCVVFSYYREWRYRQRASALGCGLPTDRVAKWPGGIDILLRNFDADKNRRTPSQVVKVCLQEMPGIATCRVRIFGVQFLHTIDPENIQAILAKQFNDFDLGSTRRGNFWPLLGSGIFTDDGQDWAHSRTLLRPQFARKQVADLEFEERHLQALLRHLPVGGNGWTAQVDLKPIFFRMTLDSATEFLFGESVHSQITALPKEARSESDGLINVSGFDSLEVGKAFDRATQALGHRARFADFHWLYNPKQFKKDCKLIHQFADFFVQRVLNADLEKVPTGKYVFLNELAKDTRDPIEIRSQLLNILLAGRDTTAGLLCWVFWVLARHPDVFDKLRRSIIDDFGTSLEAGKISFESLKSCSYLQYVMSETLRLYPTVPINSRHANKDTTLPHGGGANGKQSLFVPKGTPVDYTVNVMHRRKDLWGEDAGDFRPERWIGHKIGWEYLPFNGGPRVCLGQQFALTKTGYVIVRLLQQFDKIENLSDMPEDDPIYQYQLTTAPWEVTLRMREPRQ